MLIADRGQWMEALCQRPLCGRRAVWDTGHGISPGTLCLFHASGITPPVTAVCRTTPAIKGSMNTFSGRHGHGVRVGDGKKWRQTCIMCHRQARSNMYCKSHSPAGVGARSFSREACRFMDELSLHWGERILHRHWQDVEEGEGGTFIGGHWSGDEHRVAGTRFAVDGTVLGAFADGSKPEVVEFLGDYWHGNPRVHPGTKMNVRCGKTFGHLHRQTFERLSRIVELGYTVWYAWESDWLTHGRARMAAGHPPVWEMVLHRMDPGAVTSTACDDARRGQKRARNRDASADARTQPEGTIYKRSVE